METVLKEHVSVKKVVRVAVIMQKKIANAETAKLANVIAISMQHNNKKEFWRNTRTLFMLFKCNKKI